MKDDSKSHIGRASGSSSWSTSQCKGPGVGKRSCIPASGPITSWQIDGETMETGTDFIFFGSKITADGDCSHEIKRHLLLGRKAMTNLAAAAAATAAAKSLQSCPTLCDHIDGSPPGSPIPGILQARTLEWVAISSSNA